MSQAAILYRISQDTFNQLRKQNNQQAFSIDAAKSSYEFQGTFMALEYILTKGQDSTATELVKEIFNPTNTLAPHEWESLAPEEQFELYESRLLIPYLDTPAISRLHNLIVDISPASVQSKYNAQELNDNGIYPGVWHNDNSPDKAYNKQHILEDFEELKSIIQQANTEKDYIFVVIS